MPKRIGVASVPEKEHEFLLVIESKLNHIN